MKFITAIYNGLHGTKFGGRLNRDRHYLYSIKCLAGMGVDIICYTTKVDSFNIQEYLTKNNITNVELRIFDLEKMKHHSKIQKLKELNKEFYDQDNVWEFRSVELMWLKVYWLKEESEKNPLETYFWIDAGISHDGIIPKKYNPNSIENDYESSFQNTLAFNRNLALKLERIVKNDRLFTFYCTNRQHSYPPLYNSDVELSGSVVAGLFGGKHNAIEAIYVEFEKIVEYILSKDTLMQEELILTVIYKRRPELFSIYSFATWYHDDWACWDRNLKSFSQFFEDVI
jgi:hypothetical protein